MPEKLTPIGNALAGALGGVFANSLVYPLDTVKTKIQADERAEAQQSLPDQVIKRDGAPRRLPRSPPGIRAVAKQLLKEQGLAGFYRGYSASMINSFTMQFAYFYWATIVRGAYIERLYPYIYCVAVSPKSLSTAMELILGAVAGALAQVFTIPVSVVATRQQLDDSAVSRGLFETVSDILSEDGITGLWRGLKPSLVLTVNPAITYGMFERFRVLLLGEDGKMTPGRAFLIGALSKTLATVVTFPYIMAKVRLQAKYGPEAEDVLVDQQTSTSAVTASKAKKERYNGALDVLFKVYKTKGIAGLYQGMQAQIIKAVLAQALLFGLKDVIEKLTLQLIIKARGFRRMT